MPKIKYPLIVSDFDGTLVKEDGTISEYTKSVIRRYIEDGGRFAISTGRMPAGILPRVKELGLSGFVCCGQGTAIVDIATNETILHGCMENEIAVTVCEKMEELGLHIHVYDLWEYYSNMDDEPLKLYESIVKSKGIVVDDKPISKFVKERGMKPYKVLAMVAPEDNEPIRKILEKENFKDCTVTRSSKFLIEVGNARYSKGTAVEFLANRYRIPLENTIGIGDQFNDLPMIERAGLGIAVKNADETLKTHAVVFDYTNEEDAVAKIIEKYAYEENAQ